METTTAAYFRDPEQPEAPHDWHGAGVAELADALDLGSSEASPLSDEEH